MNHWYTKIQWDTTWYTVVHRGTPIYTKIHSRTPRFTTLYCLHRTFIFWTIQTIILDKDEMQSSPNLSGYLLGSINFLLILKRWGEMWRDTEKHDLSYISHVEINTLHIVWYTGRYYLYTFHFTASKSVSKLVETTKCGRTFKESKNRHWYRCILSNTDWTLNSQYCNSTKIK